MYLHDLLRSCAQTPEDCERRRMQLKYSYAQPIVRLTRSQKQLLDIRFLQSTHVIVHMLTRRAMNVPLRKNASRRHNAFT